MLLLLLMMKLRINMMIFKLKSSKRIDNLVDSIDLTLATDDEVNYEPDDI